VAALVGSILVAQGQAGNPIVATTLVGALPCCVAVDSLTGHVFVLNSADNTMSVLDSRTGSLLRTLAVGRMPLAVAVDGRRGRVFVGNLADPTLTVLRAHGPALSTLTLPYNVNALAVDEQLGYILAVPASASRTVALLDARSGRLVRTFGAGADVAALAVDGQLGRVFVASTGGHTVGVLDIRSGRLVHRARVGTAPSSIAVDAAGGRIFVLNSGDSTLSVLDARTGIVRNTIALAGSQPANGGLVATLALDERRGRLFVIHGGITDPSGQSTEGQLTMLDAASGRVLRTLRVSRLPIDLAVDPATSRLFLVDADAGCQGRTSIWTLVPKAVRHWLTFLPLPGGSGCPVLQGSVTVIDTARL
jgi:YVTN family beta-propeller protein